MPRAFPKSPLAAALAAVAVSAGAALPAAATCYSSFPTCPVSGDAFKSTLLATAAFPSGTAGQPMAFVDPHDRLGHRFVPLHGGRIRVWDGGAGYAHAQPVLYLNVVMSVSASFWRSSLARKKLLM